MMFKILNNYKNDTSKSYRVDSCKTLQHITVYNITVYNCI